jgi:hypothetical protein
MTYVSKEIPSGAIDGSNKVFIWLNTPSQFDDLWVDGAIYTQYSLLGNVMTLVDAPTLSIFGDYSYGPAEITAASSTTLGEIKAKVWSLLGQRSTSGSFSDAIVTDEVNSQIRHVLRGRVTSMLDPRRIYRCGKIWFSEGSAAIRIQSGSVLGADFNIGDTTMTCDTTFLLPAGYVLVGGEIFKYTGVSSTQLLGVTGGTIKHLATEKVAQLYEIPADCEKINDDGVLLLSNSYGQAETPINRDDSGLSSRYYQVIRLNTSPTKTLIKLFGFDNNDIVTVKYTKRFDNLTENTDVCPLPDDYGTTVIAPIVAGVLGYAKLMVNSPNALTIAYTNLQNMYQDFTNQTVITKQSIKAVPYSRMR